MCSSDLKSEARLGQVSELIRAADLNLSWFQVLSGDKDYGEARPLRRWLRAGCWRDLRARALANSRQPQRLALKIGRASCRERV